MSRRPQMSRDEARLVEMNRRIYPARLRLLKSGSFQFDYRKNGRSIRRVVGHELELAYERALIMRREVDDLPVISRRDVTLAEWHSEWNKGKEGKLSPSTVRGYDQCWAWVPDSLKGIRLRNLSSDRIEEALGVIISDSVKGHTGRFISIILGAAVKAGFLEKSPWQKGYQSPKRVVPLLDSDALLRLIEAAPTVQPILALAGYCGLRRGEIFALTCADFGPDPSNPEWVDVNKARVRGYGEYDGDLVKSTKTGNRRVVPIPSVALPYIVPLLASVSDKPKEPLFATFRSDVTRRIRSACTRAGLPNLTLHDLRHLCGSHIMQEAGPAAAQAVLGHRQVSTTVDVYGHLTPLYLKRQMEAGSIRDEASAMSEKAVSLLSHEDPVVAEFARNVVQLCQRLSIRNGKGATGNP